MLNIKRRSPVDYRLCNQTITIYHWDGRDAYTQQTIHNAFLDYRKNQNVDKTGSKEVNSFLLVIPTDKAIVAPKDKILQGEGSKIATREAWSKLIPETTPGLVVVRYVDPKYYQGKLVHLEAGG